MQYKIIYFNFILCSLCALGQTKDSLDEVVFSGYKFEQKLGELPLQIQTIDKEKIKNSASTNMADLLANTGTVFVQKSQMGGGSPIMRGFEANKILLYIDGVRMNNAIYRGGHLQNVITLNPIQMEKVEALYGGYSLIYGSDALGGVLNFYTQNPQTSNHAPIFNGTVLARYASANDEKTIGFIQNFGSKKWAFITSFNYSFFDDLRTGDNRSTDYPEFGKRPFYVERIDGKDVTITNKNYNRQKGTGYQQYDAMAKVLYKHNDNWKTIINTQYSTSSDIPRYDRLTETSNSSPSYSTWNYGPQKRFLVSLENHFKFNNSWLNNGKIIASYQKIDEDRIVRRFNNLNERNQEENIDVYGVNADFQKIFNSNEQLNFGVDYQYNYVNSLAYNININTETYSNASTRYPNGGSHMSYLGVYALYQKEFAPHFRTLAGLRYDYVSLHSRFNNSPFPFTDIRLNPSALSSNLGFVYHNKTWKIALNNTTGFRSPNIDDMTKVFDSTPGNVIIPNADLKPEYTYNLDVTLTKYFKPQSYISLSMYHTWIKDILVVKNGQFNGQDKIMYDGVLSQVQLLTNSNCALVRGVQLFSNISLPSMFYLQATAQYTYGKDISNEVPLDHIPPFFGKGLIGFKKNNLTVEFWTNFSAWKDLEDYSPSGEDNLIYATPEGMPSWTTLNAKINYMILKQINIQLSLENILDTHYRYFASGVSAPGRNFIVTTKFNF